MDVSTVVPTLNPEAIAATVRREWENFLLRQRRGFSTPHPHVYASAWRTCDRRMVYELRQPETMPAPSADLLAKFRRGDDRERDLLADLMRIGRDAELPFDVIGQQERFSLKDRRGREVIAGKVDAQLEIERKRYPLEVKAWHPSIVDRIDTFDDLFENPWTKSGAHQLLSYLFGSNQRYGFLLIDRSGLPMLLDVDLESHLDRMEEFLARAERIRDHYEAGTLPDFIDDATECKRCPFYGAVCNPSLSAKDVHVLTDPELEADLHRWHELREAGKEWASLDGRLKKQLRGIENAIAGPFAIQGKWQGYTRVDLPPEVKKQYSVTDPKGRFVLEIEKV